MTVKTPIYGIEYIQVGEPIRNTRQALENNAKTIEAALSGRGVPASNAADLLAVSGRVTQLEQRPLAQLHQTVSTPVSAGGWNTPIGMTGVDFDFPGSSYASAYPGRLTARTKGIYRAWGLVAISAVSVANLLAAQLRKTGTAFTASQIRVQVPANQPGGAYVESLVQLNVGDYVELATTTTTATTTFIGADFASMIGFECLRILP